MKPIYLVAGGDRHLAVNQESWPAQSALEAKIVAAVERLGRPVQRAHPVDLARGHGFIDRLKMGLDVFRSIPVDAPVIVTQAGPGDSHHVWPALSTHEGPILTVGKWSAEWPGMAGMLTLNGSLTKAGVKYASLWSETFEDLFFTEGLQRWLEKGKLKHDAEHVREFNLKPKDAPADLGDAMRTGRDFARRFRKEKQILEVSNGVNRTSDDRSVPEALLRAAGIFKDWASDRELAGVGANRGEAIQQFRESDDCAEFDGLVTFQLWSELDYHSGATSYELRWGRDYRDETMDAFVWTFLGPESVSFVPSGGEDSTPKMVGEPGWIVWSRVFVEDEKKLCYDTGIAEVVPLPATETENRWQLTTPRGIIMHVVLQGISRDQMLARHKSDRLQIAYAPDKEGARHGLFAKAAAMRELGLEVAVCGNISGER